MKKLVVPLLMTIIVLAGCGGSQPTAADLLSDSAEAMSNVETLQFAITREGDPFVLIPEQNISALGAEGAYQAPDSVHATLKVQMGSLVGEADVVWNADGSFYKLPPLINSYAPLDLGDTFDPVMIFDTEVGIPFILTNGLNNATIVGEEDLDGVATYHISADAAGSTIANLIGGAAVEGSVGIDVWLDKETKQLVNITITEGDGSRWIVDLFGYGEPVEIPSP